MPDYPLAPLARKQRYKLIAGTIMPRPIALVTTLDETGTCNAAPFSAFNYVSEDPPLVVLGLQVHPDESLRAGTQKDTTANITRSGQFVINLVDEALLDQMVICAIDFPSGVSEPELAGLALAPSQHVAPPRLAAAPFALECRVHSIMAVSDFRSVIMGEVISVWDRDGLIDPLTYSIDLASYKPVGRLTGAFYCTTTQRLQRPTPSLASWTARHDSQDYPTQPETCR